MWVSHRVSDNSAEPLHRLRIADNKGLKRHRYAIYSDYGARIYITVFYIYMRAAVP